MRRWVVATVLMVMVALALFLAMAIDNASACVDTPEPARQAPTLDALNFEGPGEIDVGFRDACAAPAADLTCIDCATMEARQPLPNEAYLGELASHVYRPCDLGRNRDFIKSEPVNLRDHAPL